MLGAQRAVRELGDTVKLPTPEVFRWEADCAVRSTATQALLRSDSIWSSKSLSENGLVRKALTPTL